MQTEGCSKRDLIPTHRKVYGRIGYTCLCSRQTRRPIEIHNLTRTLENTRKTGVWRRKKRITRGLGSSFGNALVAHRFFPHITKVALTSGRRANSIASSCLGKGNWSPYHRTIASGRVFPESSCARSRRNSCRLSPTVTALQEEQLISLPHNGSRERMSIRKRARAKKTSWCSAQLI